MPTLLELYQLDEMSRQRGDAFWAVLDWAASQPGEFTVKDMFQVFQRAGGNAGYTSFHTMVGKMVSDNPYFVNKGMDASLGDKRPFVVTKQGARGAGGQTKLRWGLDHPLREPAAQGTAAPDGETDDSAAIGDALDRLEALMGREKLKAAMARWKSMKSIHQAVIDIKSTVPMKGQMDALHVASDSLVQTGKADSDDVEAGEQEVGSPLPDAPGAASQRPAAAPVHHQPEPETDDTDPEINAPDSNDDDEEDDATSPPPAPAAPTPRPLGTPKKHTGWGKKR